jgi:pSer/pThr/pTyr-binding forkhead associated (FHA) protein
MKSFLAACGLADSLQLVVESQSTAEGELRLLHQPFAVIGRDPRADVVLDHTQVSRRHVYLQVVDGRAFWVDLDSRMGARGDGESQKSGWLEGGRILCVGPYVIRRFVGDLQTSNESTQAKLPRDAPLVALAQSHVPLAEVALDFLNGPSQSMAWPVRRMMSLIGSASGCKFRLTDASVSRFHGSLLRTSAGLWIVDLLGQGGITVNKVPVHFSHLADGDVLGIGRYQIGIRCRPGRQGSDNGLPDHARVKPATRAPRRERASNVFMFPDWAADTPPFKPATGVANGMPQFPLAIQAVSSSPKVEFMASEAAFPLKLAPSELTESMLVPLVNQFGLMQQQMFDQFQQAMAMMVQMFGTMHRDQTEVIRAELDQLRDLTEEFHALKNELANRVQEQGETVASGHSIASVGLDRSVATEPSVSAGASASGRSSNLKAARADATSAIQHPLSASSVPEQQPLAAQPPSEGFREPDPRLQARTNVTSPPADSERGSIIWLHQRILTLQRERESRWQKILKLLPGMS